jgi:spore coat protein A, manganese oxidase
MTGVGLFLRGKGMLAFAQVPGGTLPPELVTKYMTPMLIPPVMPMAGTIKTRKGQNVDYYEISMKRFSQQILPAGMPPTNVWGYGAVATNSQRGLLLHHAPSLTIEAKWGRPIRVKWINALVDENGHYLPHLLPVDRTLHWANPPGGNEGRDTRPTFSETPGPYTGPVPIVTHVHGAVGVGDESDGYAEAWYLPEANNILQTTPLKAPGMTSSVTRQRQTLEPAGGLDSRNSSTRILTALPLSGITTMPWA